MDPSAVELTAEDELRCIFRINLPTKLSSCDIRVSHFNTKRPRVQNTEIKDYEERPRITILHVSEVLEIPGICSS